MSKYLFHGTTADPLDVLLRGLVAREGRPGISLTTTARRAKDWADLKSDVTWVARVAISDLGALIPEDAWPAEPDKDFTTRAKTISPAVLEVAVGRRWTSLIDAYGELLDDDELSAWHAKWVRASRPRR
jgi:hypothetical protein